MSHWFGVWLETAGAGDVAGALGLPPLFGDPFVEVLPGVGAVVPAGPAAGGAVVTLSVPDAADDDPADESDATGADGCDVFNDDDSPPPPPQPNKAARLRAMIVCRMVISQVRMSSAYRRRRRTISWSVMLGRSVGQSPRGNMSGA